LVSMRGIRTSSILDQCKSGCGFGSDSGSVILMTKNLNKFTAEKEIYVL
jgi:hypothetical protein